MPFLILGLNNARIPTCAPAAQMSTGPTGGGEGRENLLYFAVVGTACIGAGIYVSKLKQSYMHQKRPARNFLFMVKYINVFLGLPVVNAIRVN